MHCRPEKINSGMERGDSRSVQERFKLVYLGYEVVSSVRLEVEGEVIIWKSLTPGSAALVYANAISDAMNRARS
jgi:hypothetical protein